MDKDVLYLIYFLCCYIVVYAAIQVHRRSPVYDGEKFSLVLMFVLSPLFAPIVVCVLGVYFAYQILKRALFL